MKIKKDLGVDIHGFNLRKFNIPLVVKYQTTAGESVNREALIEVITKDRETAKEVAVEKARKMLGEFSYIKNVSIEVKKREKKGK